LYLHRGTYKKNTPSPGGKDISHCHLGKNMKRGKRKKEKCEGIRRKDKI
jgi:hypothetical protein